MTCRIRREQDELICATCHRRWPVGEDTACIEPITRDVSFTMQEANLFNLLVVDQDVSIASLHRSLDGSGSVIDPRQQQQRVGAVLARLNRKLLGHRYEVVPGIARATYRLRRLQD